MKRLLILILTLAMILVCGCANKASDNSNTHTYYSLEDFESIIVGESNHKDVYKVAPSDIMYITSYGGICEYPMENGDYIRITFYGKELIVGSIEISETPFNQQAWKPNKVAEYKHNDVGRQRTASRNGNSRSPRCI